MASPRLFAALAVISAVARASAFELESAAFKAGETIPAVHTCDGADRSPPLAWRDPPAGAKSFALVCEDPDAPAGTWVHWVVYDLPSTARGLPAAAPLTPTIPDGGRQGANDFRRTGWGGPCPPEGKVHRYVFTLYALDGTLGLPAGATGAALAKATAGHVLGQAELSGRYGRR